MKALGLALAIALTSAPAEACHHFSVWKYPWPQHCGAAERLPGQTRKIGYFVNHARPKMRGYDAWKTRSDRDDWAALNHKDEVEGRRSVAGNDRDDWAALKNKTRSTPPIPLPTLEAIDWGREADEEARGRIELKAILERK